LEKQPAAAAARKKLLISAAFAWPTYARSNARGIRRFLRTAAAAGFFQKSDRFFPR
jgi:hypothetical protein